MEFQGEKQPDLDGVDEPSTPSGAEKQSEEYSFNLGLYRIETLNNILEACARKYKKAITSKEADDIREYQALVNTLYTEAYIYMEDETGYTHKDVPQSKEDILNKVLDEEKQYQNSKDRLEHLQQIRGVYLEVRQLLKEVQLDIPKEEQIGDTEIFTQT